jgi:vancomycin resistance protein YoaR
MRLWPRKQVYVDDLPRTHDLRFAGMFLVLFVTLLAALYAVGFFVAGDRLPRGTTVIGVDVGGMRRGEARTELQTELVPRLETPISVHALDRTFDVDPQLAGLTFNLEATLSDGLAGERWDPRHMLKVVMGGGPLAAIVDVDVDELDATLERIASKVERAPVNASVAFEGGKPIATTGVQGVALDYAGARDALVEALLEGDDEIDLPVDSVDPDITSDEASSFATKVAAPAVATSVRVRVADVVRTVSPRVFAPAVRAQVSAGELSLAVNAAVLALRSHDLLASLPHHPVNAGLTFRDGHPVVIPGREGVRVQRDDWAAAVLRAASKSGDSRVATAAVTPDPPHFSTAQARRLGVKERIASTQLRIPAALVSETRSLAARLDGALTRPDGTFSVAKRVGTTDSDAATVVATAAFDAAFRAGMSNIERTAPRVQVAGSEPGLDALGTGLAWRNGTPFGVYVRAIVTGSDRGAGELSVQLWSTTYWRVSVTSSGRYNVVEPAVERRGGRDCRPQTGSDGFDVDVSRTFSGAGSGQRVETVHSEYAVVDTVVCRRR